MVPLRYTGGGVTRRPGHTEAATGACSPLNIHFHPYTEPLSITLLLDLCKLASLPAVGLLCELVKPDDPMGEMARRDDCKAFAEKWGLKMISIEGLKEFIGKKGGDWA